MNEVVKVIPYRCTFCGIVCFYPYMAKKSLDVAESQICFCSSCSKMHIIRKSDDGFTIEILFNKGTARETWDEEPDLIIDLDYICEDEGKA